MFDKHRSRFLEALRREDAAAVIPTGTTKLRNADSDYRFRPHSDFYYLTGFAEPDAVLVLRPGAEDGETVLFLRERNRDEEIWTGRRVGVEAAPERLGVDRALPIEALWDELPDLLVGASKLVHPLGEDAAFDRGMIETFEALRLKVKRGAKAPLQWLDPAPSLHELRLFKGEDELARMRRGAEITAEAHVAAMREAAPGVNEAEIDALLDYTFRRRGGLGPAYNNIVAGGENACILHYIENDQPLRAGDLLLIDAGAEYGYYATDVTRTFPVDGSFSDEQRRLYQLVLDAQKAALDVARPGSRFVDMHERAVETLCAGLIELGLLSGTVEHAVGEASYRRFYMHKTGHWLGMDVHDCGGYFVDGEPRRLEPGMVLTVEPGLYVAADDDAVDARWRGIGIRIEDDVLITPTGHEVLTAAVPKEIDEVEAACRGAELQAAR